MDFSRVIFMTDLDGTLFTDDKRILDKDMRAIERFRAGGGMFTVATGRGYSMTKRAADELALDIPAVLYNGAGVYDFTGDRFLWQCEIGPQAREYIRRLAELFPEVVGIEVLHKRAVFVPYLNDAEREHLDMENVIPDLRPLDEIPEGGWLKFVIAARPEVLDEVEKAVVREGFGQAQWVRSSPVYFECLPKGVDKSRGFSELIRLLKAEERFTVAAGDYNNDTAMIRKADLGCSVASALDSVKAAADLVVCDNNSGAISEIIDYIEAM
ncbi:MAG: HAD-IIB family hydrolase [Oscillospiraceae bacterium]|nr:HAD-IIB family hydrolase [Oscillospiraceae bacterium]